MYNKFMTFESGYGNLPDTDGYRIPDRIVKDSLAAGEEPPLWYAGQLERDPRFDIEVIPVPGSEHLDLPTEPRPVTRPNGHPDDFDAEA